jgi:hypothetical protein
MPVAYPKENHTPELIARVRKEYQEGMSSWDLMIRYRGIASRNTIRGWLEDILRPSGSQEAELSESEVAQRAAEIKANWEPEVASKRWVGRWGVPTAEYRGSCLSRHLRAMGGKDG